MLRAVHDLQPDLPLVLLLPNTGAHVDAATLDQAREYTKGVSPRSVVDSVAGVHDAAREPLRVDQPEPCLHVGG